MRGSGITSDYINAIMPAGNTDAGIELLDVLYGKTLRNSERHRYLPRPAIHGIYIREVDYRRLIAQVLQRHVCQVKVHILKQQIGGDENIGVGRIVEHGSIVAYSHRGRAVSYLEPFC